MRNQNLLLTPERPSIDNRQPMILRDRFRWLRFWEVLRISLGGVSF